MNTFSFSFDKRTIGDIVDALRFYRVSLCYRDSDTFDVDLDQRLKVLISRLVYCSELIDLCYVSL